MLATMHDTTKYHLILHNFITGNRIEVYPHYVVGLSTAEWKVDELNRALLQEKRDAGESWYLQKGPGDLSAPPTIRKRKTGRRHSYTGR